MQQITAHNQNGFTLIELLLYAAVASVMVTALSTFFILSLQSRTKNQTIASVEQQGLAAMEVIKQEIRNAQSVTSPTAGNSAAALQLVDGAGETVEFELVSGRLQMTDDDPAVETLLTADSITVENVTFTNLTTTSAEPTIRIEFDVTHNNPEGRQEYSYSQSFISSSIIR